MEVTAESVGDVQVIALNGRLDASSAQAVEEKIFGLIDGGAKCLLLDLTGMDFVSSIGLRVFILTAKRLKAAGACARFCGMQNTVRRVFEIAGLASRMDIYPTRA